MTKEEMLEEMKALLDWKMKKMEQCKKCQARQKADKELIKMLSETVRGIKMSADAIAQQRGMVKTELTTTYCGCGGNCGVEGQDCEC